MFGLLVVSDSVGQCQNVEMSECRNVRMSDHCRTTVELLSDSTTVGPLSDHYQLICWTMPWTMCPKKKRGDGWSHPFELRTVSVLP